MQQMMMAFCGNSLNLISNQEHACRSIQSRIAWQRHGKVFFMPSL
jgi:hypothetical protein